MALGAAQSPARLVEQAIDRFNAGDDEAFARSFAPDATVWADTELAPTCVLSGRNEIAAWCREARSRWSAVRFSRGELIDHGAGAYVELDVISDAEGGGGAWRLSIGVFVQHGLVTEVLPQPDRASALAVLEAR